MFFFCFAYLVSAPPHRTPLHLACRWGRVGAIRALIQAGADVDRPAKDGRTPAELLKVEMGDKDRREILKLLGKHVFSFLVFFLGCS